MRKIWILLLIVVVLVVCFVRCGSTVYDTAQTETAVTQPQPTEEAVSEAEETQTTESQTLPDSYALIDAQEAFGETEGTKPSKTEESSSTTKGNSSSSKTTKPTQASKPSTTATTAPKDTSEPTEAEQDPSQPSSATKPEDPSEPTSGQPEDPSEPSEEETVDPSEPDESQSGVTYEEYMAMTGDQQQTYYTSFASADAFFAWFNEAKKEYDEQKQEVELGDKPVDLEQILGDAS